MHNSITNLKPNNLLIAALIDTKLGTMLAIASDNNLYLLEFTDYHKLKNRIKRLEIKTKQRIVFGENLITKQITTELNQYFNKELTIFKTPIYLLGTDFQKTMWQELLKIPLGKVTSYLNIAKTLNIPHGARAIASANGANQLAIIVPCHRVISSSGHLTGYAGGLARKQWLIEHEANFNKDI